MAPPAEPPTVPTNLRAPLWSHVQIIEKSPGGGNTKWKCNYCGHEALSSYSRVSAHLLKKTGNHGIHACKKTSPLISRLTEERNSAIQQNNKLREELDLVRREISKQNGNGGFPLVFVVAVALLGILLGYLMKR